MTIWRKGMLAVALDTTPCKRIQKGCIYQVIEVHTPGYRFIFGGVEYTNNNGFTMLRFSETARIPDGSDARKFRPAVQDNKAADEKFTALIKRSVKA